MKYWYTIFLLTLLSYPLAAQNFQLVDRQENYQTMLNETLRIPIKIKNNTDKAQFYVIRKVGTSDLGGSQKAYFCLDKNCLEPGMDEFSKKIEPGETLQNLYYTLESGLVAGQNTIKFEVFAKGAPSETLEHTVNIVVEEKKSGLHTFQSKEITIHDIYPNPVQNEAFIDYTLHNESTKAKVVIHNILGRTMGEYELPYQENKIKVQADELASGIYFYTLYLDNSGVVTRKLIVRK